MRYFYRYLWQRILLLCALYRAGSCSTYFRSDTINTIMATFFFVACVLCIYCTPLLFVFYLFFIVFPCFFVCFVLKKKPLSVSRVASYVVPAIIPPNTAYPTPTTPTRTSPPTQKHRVQLNSQGFASGQLLSTPSLGTAGQRCLGVATLHLDAKEARATESCRATSGGR